VNLKSYIIILHNIRGRRYAAALPPLGGEFLGYKNVVPRQNPIAVTVKRKRLIESIDRVSVVIFEKLKSPWAACSIMTG
jgi:hypothetical protein